MPSLLEEAGTGVWRSGCAQFRSGSGRVCTTFLRGAGKNIVSNV